MLDVIVVVRSNHDGKSIFYFYLPFYSFLSSILGVIDYTDKYILKENVN